MKIAFLIFLGLFVYTYALFPILLLLRTLVVRRRHTVGNCLPTVSMIIAANNEEDSIGDKLDNLTRLDYPPERLQIIVASDGSDDATNSIVRDFDADNVVLLDLPRRGKIPAINDAAQTASGEVLVFSDANSMFQPDALRNLVRHFADSQVGAVAGNQVYDGGTGNTASTGERLYWRFDRWLKSMQSRSGNVIASTGAIHAIRASLFLPLPSGVNDDFVISARAIEQGSRLIFDPQAIAVEGTAPTDKAEFGRRTRIITRGLRALWVLRGLFNPLRFGFYSLQLASHKLLRWTSGWIMLGLLLTSLAVIGEGWFYQTVGIGQIVAYLAAAVVALTPSRLRRRLPKLLAIPYYFAMVNVATIWAWCNVLRGQRLDRWNTTRELDTDPTVEPSQSR